MTNRLISFIAAFGLAACQPAPEPADPISVEEAAPAAVPAPEVVVEPAPPATKNDTPAPAVPSPAAPATAPMTDHSGHDMSTMPATPKQ